MAESIPKLLQDLYFPTVANTRVPTMLTNGMWGDVALSSLGGEASVTFPWVTPEQFGGKTGLATQAAVDSLPESGGVVMFSGEYDFSDIYATSPRGVLPKSNVKFLGNNAVITSSSRLKCAFSAGIDRGVTHSHLENVVFEGLTFRGSNADALTYIPRRGSTNTSETAGKDALLWGIVIYGDREDATWHTTVNNVTVRNCRFENLELGGVVIRGAGGFVRVHDNEFYNCIDSIYSFNEHLSFVDNQVLYSRDNGVSIERSNTNIVCTGNVIDGSAYDGIYCGGYESTTPAASGPADFTIVGNTITRSGFYGIALQNAPSYGVVSGNVIDTVYRGFFNVSGQMTDDNMGIGIFLTYYPETGTPSATTRHLLISDNVIRSAYRAGIIGKGLQYVDIIGNRIINAGTEHLVDGTTHPQPSQHNKGIYLYSTSITDNLNKHCRIIGNIISDDRATKLTNKPIELSYGSWCIVKDNTAVGTLGTIEANLYQDSAATNWFQKNDYLSSAAAAGSEPDTQPTLTYTDGKFDESGGNFSAGHGITYKNGHIIYRNSAAVGKSVGWVCINDGTAGTYSEGLTATCNNTATVTLSGKTSIIQVGMWLKFDGSTQARVNGIDYSNAGFDVLTMNSSIAKNASGLAVTYYNGFWKPFGMVDNDYVASSGDPATLPSRIGLLHKNTGNNVFSIAFATANTTDWTTLVARDAVQTLTNKTLTSPVINSPTGITAADVGAVPTTRTVNSKALSADITLSATDIAAVTDKNYVTDLQRDTIGCAVLGVAGALTVTTYTMRRYINGARTIKKIVASVGTAPTGANLTFDIKVNGGSHGINAADLSITAGNYTVTDTSFDNAALADGDYLTLNVTGVGSTVAGSDLVVVVYFS